MVAPTCYNIHCVDTTVTNQGLKTLFTVFLAEVLGLDRTKLHNLPPPVFPTNTHHEKINTIKIYNEPLGCNSLLLRPAAGGVRGAAIACRCPVRPTSTPKTAGPKLHDQLRLQYGRCL